MPEAKKMTAPVIYSIAVSSPITPAEPLPPLPTIPCGSLVIVEGAPPSGATAWRCTYYTARPQRPSRSTIRSLVLW